MVQRDGGTVTILGRDSRTASVRSKEEIGVVLGSEGIPLCLNAVEVGKVMAGIYRNWDAGDYTAFCRKFDLPPDKKYKDYSAGMQRKLCIAVALSHHAKLLLLDEATNGLDPVVRDEVVDILLDFARDEERSILISSHIVSDLEKLCDTIAFLHKGRLLLCEEKDALRDILITFGGTDMPDYTRQTLDTVEPLCRERGIAIRVVTGPGYAHRDELVRHIKALGNPLLRFEYATNIMSRMMEGVDLAICSAGRTVYELAHMHIPSIVLAQHEREARHTFARADHGFAYMGIMRKFNAGRLRKVFVELIDEPERRNVLYQRQSRIHFEKNKAKVVSGILKLLKKEKES